MITHFIIMKSQYNQSKILNKKIAVDIEYP